MMKNEITLGVSGEMGSFSEEAGLLYAQRTGIKVTLIYLMDMEGVLSAVEAGEVKLGIFPVVNFRGGLVRMAFDAMGSHLFTPIDELWLDVQQCLLARSETKSEAIERVVSHPQALAQCQQFLQQKFPHAELVEWEDTAQAAKDLATGKFNSSTAVLAPERSAHVYGLKIMAKNIQDNRPNLTAFIIVKH
jgi:prephenate dehydratase